MDISHVPPNEVYYNSIKNIILRCRTLCELELTKTMIEYHYDQFKNWSMQSRLLNHYVEQQKFLEILNFNIT